jgi:nucleoside-diphosphate-sugar epimerase
MEERHVVLGAGQVGSLLARELVARGLRVKQIRRSAGPGTVGIEVVPGDMSDLGFAEKATRGATVLYDCLSPSNYDRWPQELPGLHAGVLHAAARSGAKLVQLGNLYPYGAPDAPMREDTPFAPCSRKGHLRARLDELTLEASRRGEIRVAILRASDFYGPGFERATLFGPHFYHRVLAGKSALCQGDADQLHSYSYGPDVAHAMLRLGQEDDVFGRVWHAPTAAAETTRSVIARFSAALGREIRIQKLPDWVLRSAGLFAPVLREVAEMTYQWKKAFVIDDSAWRARFGGGATPFEEGVAATARWAVESRRHATAA